MRKLKSFSDILLNNIVENSSSTSWKKWEIYRKNSKIKNVYILTKRQSLVVRAYNYTTPTLTSKGWERKLFNVGTLNT